MEEELIEDIRLPSRAEGLDPRAYCARLLKDCPEFSHLAEGEVDICWIESVAGLSAPPPEMMLVVQVPRNGALEVGMKAVRCWNHGMRSMLEPWTLRS